MLEHASSPSQVRCRPMLGIIGVLLLTVTLITSCSGSERLLSVQFSDEKAGDPPAINQEVGKVRTTIDFGEVRIALVPKFGVRGKWVQLTQRRSQEPATKLRALLAASRGDGHYLITMRLFVPTRMTAFISFETFGEFNGVNFLSLTFEESGWLTEGSSGHSVRYPQDKVFSLAVNLNIGATSTAVVTVLGNIHSSLNVTLTPRSNEFARQFAEVRLGTDLAQDGGTFFANDLSVIYTP